LSYRSGLAGIFQYLCIL